jgi:hypothetical protein
MSSQATRRSAEELIAGFKVIVCSVVSVCTAGVAAEVRSSWVPHGQNSCLRVYILPSDTICLNTKLTDTQLNSRLVWMLYRLLTPQQQAKALCTPSLHLHLSLPTLHPTHLSVARTVHNLCA